MRLAAISEIDGGEEVLGEAVVSGGDSAEVLQPAEHALDGIALAVEDGRIARFPAAVDLGRNVRRGAIALDLSPDGIAVVAFVAMNDVGLWHQIQQGVGRGAIGHLAAGQEEGDRAALTIGQGVDLGGAPATRAADGLVEFPPFPPAAQRWALTAEESISNSAGGPPAEASA